MGCNPTGGFSPNSEVGIAPPAVSVALRNPKALQKLNFGIGFVLQRELWNVSAIIYSPKCLKGWLYNEN
jgi:hypothetical protein